MAGRGQTIEELLFVDGYNILGAWPETPRLQGVGLDAAREVLIERIADHCGYLGHPVILVFDAHLTRDPEHSEQFGELEVVFTAPGCTADQYIERRVALLRGKAKVRVASSDALVQGTIMTYGGLRVSAREFLEEMEHCRKDNLKRQHSAQPIKAHLLDERLDPELRCRLERLRHQGRG